MEEDAMLKYIDVNEAAKRSGISADTWSSRCERGRVSGAVKVDGVWKVPSRAISVWGDE